MSERPPTTPRRNARNARLAASSPTSAASAAASLLLLLLVAASAPRGASSFQRCRLPPPPPPPLPSRGRSRARRRPLFAGGGGGGGGGDPLDLRAELTEYLRVREERNADEEAAKQVGRVVGGTRGNAVLDYVSGSPNREMIIEDPPGAFDYDELIKYGFGHLVTPIMDAGGRMEAYRLMDMTPPPVPERAKAAKSAPKLVIDRTGDSDPGRYSGLRMGQVLDDDEMGRRLAEVQERAGRGERIKPKLAEEDYVQPFADKRNVGPKMVPDWTPEKIDEQARRAGRAQAWAKRARAGEFKRDPYEALAVEGGLRAYCVLTAFLTSFAFGRASPAALAALGIAADGGGGGGAESVLGPLRAPALALVAAAVASSALCAAVLAPERNRSVPVWAIKGLAGGPLAALQLRGLDALITRGEAEAAEESS